MSYLVIDFGGTLVKYSVMNEECEVLLAGEENAPIESKELFTGFISGLFGQVKTKEDIRGIAISMPGAIDAGSGYVKTAGAYTSLYGINLYEELKPCVPVPVTVENDGKCGALAEVWRGGLSDCRDGIVLILGTGVAGGIIKDRAIHRGADLSAGEFSFMLMGDQAALDQTELCKCSTSALLFEAMRRKGILCSVTDQHRVRNHCICKSLLHSEGTDHGSRRISHVHRVFQSLDLPEVACQAITENAPEAFFWGPKEDAGHYWIEKPTGTGEVKAQIEAGMSAAQIKGGWQEETEAFKGQRRPYLLYEE